MSGALGAQSAGHAATRPSRISSSPARYARRSRCMRPASLTASLDQSLKSLVRFLSSLGHVLMRSFFALGNHLPSASSSECTLSEVPRNTRIASASQQQLLATARAVGDAAKIPGHASVANTQKSHASRASSSSTCSVRHAAADDAPATSCVVEPPLGGTSGVSVGAPSARLSSMTVNAFRRSNPLAPPVQSWTSGANDATSAASGAAASFPEDENCSTSDLTGSSKKRRHPPATLAKVGSEPPRAAEAAAYVAHTSLRSSIMPRKA
mmetsp:Transcript_17682/g.70981  ORF Transcript_17682/g.70981 Transcript_17682/m.70981 type:complete len:267 (-) Transcript_17682:389-1189(-)